MPSPGLVKGKVCPLCPHCQTRRHPHQCGSTISSLLLIPLSLAAFLNWFNHKPTGTRKPQVPESHFISCLQAKHPDKKAACGESAHPSLNCRLPLLTEGTLQQQEVGSHSQDQEERNPRMLGTQLALSATARGRRVGNVATQKRVGAFHIS